jgi:hypothetical protein
VVLMDLKIDHNFNSFPLSLSPVLSSVLSWQCIKIA